MATLDVDNLNGLLALAVIPGSCGSSALNCTGACLNDGAKEEDTVFGDSSAEIDEQLDDVSDDEQLDIVSDDDEVNGAAMVDEVAGITVEVTGATIFNTFGRVRRRTNVGYCWTTVGLRVGTLDDSLVDGWPTEAGRGDSIPGFGSSCDDAGVFNGADVDDDVAGEVVDVDGANNVLGEESEKQADADADKDSNGDGDADTDAEADEDADEDADEEADEEADEATDEEADKDADGEADDEADEVADKAADAEEEDHDFCGAVD